VENRNGEGKRRLRNQSGLWGLSQWGDRQKGGSLTERWGVKRMSTAVGKT